MDHHTCTDGDGALIYVKSGCVNRRSDAFAGVASAQSVKAGWHHLAVEGEVLSCHSPIKMDDIARAYVVCRVLHGLGSEWYVVVERGIADLDSSEGLGAVGFGYVGSSTLNDLVKVGAVLLIHSPESTCYGHFLSDDIGSAAFRINLTETEYRGHCGI